MNFRLLFSTSILAASGALIAQPVLTAANSVGSAGMEFPVSTSNTYDNAGPSGADQLFGFWLPASGNRTYYYLSPSVTPSSNMVPSATILTTDGGSDTLFYGISAEGLELKAERLALANGVITYSDPALELKLPCSYGDTWSDNLASSYTVSGFAVTRSGQINGVADAWGSLDLPEATMLNVLRVKVRKVIADNSAITNLNRRIEVNYFFNGSLGHPVLKLTLDTTIVGTGNPAVTRTAEWMFGPGQVGVSELSYDDVQFTAYPNPATAEVSLRMNDVVRTVRFVEVLDATGQVVMQQNVLNGSNNEMRSAFDVSGMAQGVYQVRVYFSDGTRSTRALVVQ